MTRCWVVTERMFSRLCYRCEIGDYAKLCQHNIICNNFRMKSSGSTTNVRIVKQLSKSRVTCDWNVNRWIGNGNGDFSRSYSFDLFSEGSNLVECMCKNVFNRVEHMALPNYELAFPTATIQFTVKLPILLYFMVGSTLSLWTPSYNQR